MLDRITFYKQNLIKKLGSTKNTAFLDYGCGKGDFIKLLLAAEDTRPKTIFAIDSSKTMIQGIKKNYAKEIELGLLVPKQYSNLASLKPNKFDKIVCNNVLECIDNKLDFINEFKNLLNKNGVCILSHYDFDSAIYNSQYKELTRNLIHTFADIKQSWQAHCDGQMGRKLPGLIASSFFSKTSKCETWRIVEYDFQPGNYGFLMAQLIFDIAESSFNKELLQNWLNDLELKSKNRHYYFAIDLNVTVLIL
ncbi:biotin biosynthesis protein BioC [Legionella busanensis]|uniref:Biotin biosynthesis protein BioC n=1 Tax=Legionella busanensis TaxID=190655 RepID=A0A378JL07_9GAMM|nr:methyltransferase domain-containing protein [Legionella busanensis]STX51757.1 biotin biosynthesis protein BioC [Legionella busanensis]